MNCKKCKKEIPDGSLYCNWCGKKQEKTKQKVHRRAKTTGSINFDSRYAKPYIARTPRTAGGGGYKYIGAFSTRAEAQTALDAYFSDIHPKLYNATVAQIYDRWSAVHFEGLTDSGIQGYRAAYKSISEISSLKIRELKTADYQRCIDACSRSGFSRSKCEKIRQLCSQLCKYAMQNDVIDKNYAEFLKLPKEEKKEKTIFTNDEINILWEHSDDERVQVILFMIYTGFRIGEVFSIMRENVYLDEGYIVGGLKTEAGKNRIVPIIPEIEPFVRSWYTKYNGEMFYPGKASIFRNASFYPCLAELKMIAPAVPKEYKRPNGKTYTKYEFENPRLTPHSCRHTFASLSVEAGISPESLQKIIGHSKYETTADIYVHEDIDKLKSEMQKLKIVP